MKGGAVRVRELALFNRQLAEMLLASVPLPVAVARAAAEVAGRGPRRMLAEVERAVRDGATLAESLEPHRDRLPELYVRMVRAGAMAGNLPEVLALFAAYAESRLAFERKLKEATAYPKLVLAFFVPVVLFLFLFVGPELVRLTERGGLVPGSPGLGPILFRAMKSALAAVDAAIVHVGAYPVETALLAGLGGLGLFVLGQGRAGRTARAALGALWMRLPFLGPIAHQGALALILRGLASLVRAGIPLPEALRLVASSTDVPAARASLDRLAARAADGERFSDGLAHEPFFPPYAAWLLAKDEGGADFAAALTDAADHYQSRMEGRIESFKVLILPTAEVILGLVVLACYFTFVLPVIAPPKEPGHWAWNHLDEREDYVQELWRSLRERESVRRR